MAGAILLTSSDLMPLRSNLEAMEGALNAVEAAVEAHGAGRLRQYNLVDRRPGEFEGIRVSLSAGDDLLSGMRVFGNPPHTRAFMLFDGETRQMLALMDYGVLNSLRVGAIAGVAGRYLAPPNAPRHGTYRLRLAGATADLEPIATSTTMAGDGGAEIAPR